MSGRSRPAAPRRLAKALPLSTDPAAVRARLTALEALLERRFVIPGLRMPVGLDGIIGLVPVVGDVVTTAMGAYLIWEARNCGLSRWGLARMGGNVLFDTAIGAIPLIGDLADFAFRSNSRNLRLLMRHLDKHHPASCIIIP